MAGAARAPPPSAMAHGGRGPSATALGHGGCGQSAGAHGQGRCGHGVQEGQGWTPAVGGGRWWGSGRRSIDAALAMANRTRRHPIDQVQSKKYKGARRSFQFAKYLKIKNKRGKYPKWRYNQVINVWSPIFTMSMFEMAHIRSTLFQVPFLQFSLRHWARCSSSRAASPPCCPSVSTEVVLPFSLAIRLAFLLCADDDMTRRSSRDT